MRATQPLSYVIEAVPPVPPVLAYLAAASGMKPGEAYGTFNMGAGFALYVTARSADRAREIAAKHGPALLDAGHVSAGPRRVVLEPLGITFEGESLTIR
jgi:phosphoribosylformylglycinamidine cyclo-ligase